MEAKNENGSESEPDKRKRSRKEIKKQLWETISAFTENEAKVQLFIERLALDEESAFEEPFKRENENKDIYFGYKSEGENADKIIFIFRRYAKLMTTKEFKEELLKCEPILAQKWKAPLKSVSEIVYRALKYECLVRYKKAGHYGFTYGLPEWFDENNKLIERFRR